MSLIEMFYKAFVLISLGMLLSKPNNCLASEWDTTDKVLFGSLVALQVVDTAQTWKVHNQPDFYKEKNPLYGSDPNMAVVVGVKVLVTTGIYWIVKDMSGPDRKLILSVVDLLQFGVVENNYKIGLRFGF